MRDRKISGQIILEVLISVALFALVAFSVAVILKDVVSVLVNGMEKLKAVYLAKEGLEAVRAIAHDDFTQLKEGVFDVETANGRWELGTSKESGRQIYIEPYQSLEDVKKVQVKLTWKKPSFATENSLVLSEYFTNIKTFALEFNSSSYLIGQPIPWHASAYTIVFSIKPKTLSQTEGTGLFASQDTSKTPSLPGLLQIEFDGSANYQLRINDNIFVIGPATNKWTQIAVTWDGTELKIYYNGEKTFSQSLLPNQGAVQFRNYLLGISADRTKSFDGFYKNLMIFERAVSEEEISTLFSGQLPSLDGLKLYWKMNEGEGNLVRDFSPSNIAGNIVGQPLWKQILTISSWQRVADF